MLNWFKKKKSAPANPGVKLVDMEQQSLLNGDKVECLRYEMGLSHFRENPEKPNDYFYESIASGQKVSYLKMVDAHTGFQKVRKV